MAKKKTTVKRADIEALKARERAVLTDGLPLRGTCDQKEIERAIGKTASSVLLAVRKLVRDGYLYEKKAQREGFDARGTKYVYGLTDEGRDAMQSLRKNPNVKKKIKKEPKLSSHEQAKKSIEGEKRWFRRSVIATVGEEIERMKKGGKTKKKACCLAAHLTRNVDRDRACMFLDNARAVDSILFVEGYDPKQHAHVLPDMYKGRKEIHLRKLQVVGIVKGMEGFVQEVREGLHGALQAPKKTDTSSSDSEPVESMEEKLERILGPSN